MGDWINPFNNGMKLSIEINPNMTATQLQTSQVEKELKECLVTHLAGLRRRKTQYERLSFGGACSQ